MSKREPMEPKEFNSMLDQLVLGEPDAGQPLPGKYRPLLELARQMLEDNPDPQGQIEARTWLQIQSRFNGRPQLNQSNPKRKTLMTANISKRTTRLAWGILLAGLLLGLLFFTPLGAQAQEWFRRIGDRLFTHGPTYAEQFEASLAGGTPTATTDPQITPLAWPENQALSVEAAARLAGFEVYQPGYVPEGFDFVFRNVTQPDADHPVAVVTTIYMRATDGRNFLITQSPLQDEPAGELPVGDAQVADITVRGVTGLWVEGLRLSTFVNEDEQVDPQYANLLAWEENGFEIIIQTTAGLPLETMLMIADGLH